MGTSGRRLRGPRFAAVPRIVMALWFRDFFPAAGDLHGNDAAGRIAGEFEDFAEGFFDGPDGVA